MNILTNRIKLLAIILLLTLSQIDFYAQGSLQREIAVVFVSARCVDTTYTLSPNQTNVYPPHHYYIKDKLVYEIKISLKLNGDGFVFNQPLALTCYLPNDGLKTIIVNQENNVLTSTELYEFVMVVKTNQKGWSKITASGWDDYNLRMTHYDGIRFIDGSFYLE